MWDTWYLLDMGALMKNTEGQCHLLKELEALPDRKRLLKYQACKNKKAAMQSLGAGVLLRLAVQEFTEGHARISERLLTPEAVIEALRGKELFEASYRYGEQGKPYFDGIPLYFSLSHSGTVVLLAVCEQEIGADVQEIARTRWRSLARRFFSDAEKVSLESYEDEEAAKSAFFRLWTRKEAYGKLTGNGLLSVISDETEKLPGNLCWKDACFVTEDAEYCYSICRYPCREE